MKFLKNYLAIPAFTGARRASKTARNNSMKRTLINWLSGGGKLTCTTSQSLRFLRSLPTPSAAEIFKRIMAQGEG